MSRYYPQKKVHLSVITFGILLITSAVPVHAGRQYSILVNQKGFVEVGGDQSKLLLAPVGSRFEILKDEDGTYVVRFMKISPLNVAHLKAYRFADFSIPMTDLSPDTVKLGTNYMIGQDI